MSDRDFSKIYAESVYHALCEVDPLSQNQVLENFVEVLKERRHLFLFEEIIKEFKKISTAPEFQKNKRAIEELNYQVVKNRDKIIAEEEGRVVIKIDE